jgi:ABC-type transport system involved in cytochrome bd biosynthesis fused ATPase/permease subunit
MIISKSILIVVLFCGLLVINTPATLSLFLILFFIYLFIFYFSNKRVKENLKKIELLKYEKSLLVNDVLIGKSISTKKEESKIIKKYFSQSYELSRHQSFNNVISKLPRYLMMFLVFSFVVILSTYLVHLNQGNMSNVMPKMLLFIVIGLKLLPQIQNVFINYLKLKSNIVSFTNIRGALFEAGK